MLKKVKELTNEAWFYPSIVGALAVLAFIFSVCIKSKEVDLTFEHTIEQSVSHIEQYKQVVDGNNFCITQTRSQVQKRTESSGGPLCARQ